MSNKCYFDTHTHSINSHDGKYTVNEMAEAVSKTPLLCGFAVTDHCDILHADKERVRKSTESSVRDANKCKANSKTEVFAGIEIGDGINDLEFQNEILSSHNFDVVIGSIHIFYFKGKEIHPTKEDFSTYSDNELYELMKVYIENMIKLVDVTPCDILAHITYPLRYINGKHKKNFEPGVLDAEVEKLFSKIIEKGIALEVNTSGLGTDYGELIPPIGFLRKYKEMGGTLISLGSDAHVKERVGNGFEKAVSVLKELGFDSCVYFKDRKMFKYKI